MKREYFIFDDKGQRQLSDPALPLRVGGESVAGIVIAGIDADEHIATIALADGHVFIQPAKSDRSVFHNDERLTESAWLKSGDQVQVADTVMSWEVQGDRVVIRVRPFQQDAELLRPPKQPLASTTSDNLPVSEQEPHSNGKKRLRRSLLILVSGLALLAAYLLIATSVMIKVEPQIADIELNGFPPVVSPGSAYLAFPGSYELVINAPGYVALTTEVDISMGPAMNLSYVLNELPGLIKIETNEMADLQLFVDGVEIDSVAHGVYEITRGTHSLRVESGRFLPFEQDLEVNGFGAEQLLEITLEPAWAKLAIATTPPNAEILVDDKLLGLTPSLIEVIQGQHEIRLQLSGFKPVVMFRQVEAGKDFSIDDIQLEPVDGKVTLLSQPAGASILIGDKFYGSTPQTLNIAAETDHQLRLSKAGYTTTSREFRLAPDEQRNIEVKLPVEYGTVFLKVHPADAILTINGKKSTQSGGRLRLQTRQTTLELSKPGYLSQQVKVTPQAGVSETVSVTLLSQQQKQVQEQQATRPNLFTTVEGQTMELIEATGSFQMGASRRDAGRRSNESQRLVELQRPFYLAHNEVTNADFRRFNPKHDSGSIDSAALNGEKQPVVNISWEEAARYCNWLSEQQGLAKAYREDGEQMLTVIPMTTGYRLPTEAEWAWVARRHGFESEQRYPWQGSFPPAKGSGNYADARIADTLVDVVPGYDDGYRGTAPVGSFPSWPDSFHDMGGNAAEWMHDFYAVYPGESNKLAIDPAGPSKGKHHVVRGASWRNGNMTELRLSYRSYSSKPRYDLGFRIARYAD